ncbi:MAG: hypothetical protein JW708_01180 [Vallitaleaceae bacterium]|nr:hypothetical protein [Vallitaleaceae bacterium]
MNRIKQFKRRILLSENARLFDTKEYLMKTFLAVLIAGLVGKEVSYLSKDMISMLFGMVLTLEPANMSGIRSGLGQIKATLIGAAITGIIVAFFGYNVITMAAGITLTIYVSMVINWREIMVVAVFTSIYMTQYVQTDGAGNLSEIETIKLRLLALGSGILIALFVNFVFSIFGYKKIVNKRIYYIYKSLYEHMEDISSALVNKNIEEVKRLQSELPPLFNTIDWIYSTLSDVALDKKRFRFVYRHFDPTQYLEHCVKLRSVNHVLYDLCYRCTNNSDLYFTKHFINSYDERIGYFSRLTEAFQKEQQTDSCHWKETDMPWINQFSRAIEILNGSVSKN